MRVVKCLNTQECWGVRSDLWLCDHNQDSAVSDLLSPGEAKW